MSAARECYHHSALRSDLLGGRDGVKGVKESREGFSIDHYSYNSNGSNNNYNNQKKVIIIILVEIIIMSRVILIVRWL